MNSKQSRPAVPVHTDLRLPHFPSPSRSFFQHRAGKAESKADTSLQLISSALLRDSNTTFQSSSPDSDASTPRDVCSTFSSPRLSSAMSSPRESNASLSSSPCSCLPTPRETDSTFRLPSPGESKSTLSSPCTSCLSTPRENNSIFTSAPRDPDISNPMVSNCSTCPPPRPSSHFSIPRDSISIVSSSHHDFHPSTYTNSNTVSPSPCIYSSTPRNSNSAFSPSPCTSCTSTPRGKTTMASSNPISTPIHSLQKTLRTSPSACLSPSLRKIQNKEDLETQDQFDKEEEFEYRRPLDSEHDPSDEKSSTSLKRSMSLSLSQEIDVPSSPVPLTLRLGRNSYTRPLGSASFLSRDRRPSLTDLMVPGRSRQLDLPDLPAYLSPPKPPQGKNQ
eukprot:g7651.t1